jgi:hypothetical protein
MDQKMKRFDSNIEQMMNESEVAPPFGMWNRISAQLDAEVAAVPPPASSPIPQRSVYGFIAGALLIGASLVTAYVLNDKASNEEPSGKTAAVVTTKTNKVNSSASTILPAVSKMEQPAILTASAEVKHDNKIATSTPKTSKPAALVVAATEANKNEIATANQQNKLPLHTDVAVPSNNVVAEGNTNNEPYYFPAVDNISVAPAKTETAVATTKVTKTEKTEEKERIFSASNDAPRIKFRPKKHRSFSYGKIIRKR